MEKQSCVYILASGKCGAIYTGVTSNLIARLYQHREGITKGWAASKNALHLVWYEMHGDMESAIGREKAIKKWLRDWKLNLICARTRSGLTSPSAWGSSLLPVRRLSIPAFGRWPKFILSLPKGGNDGVNV